MKEIIRKYNPLIIETKGNRIFTARGETVLCFKIIYPEKYSQSSTDFERMHSDWTRALAMLPIGVTVLKSDWYEKEKFNGDELPQNGYLSKATADYFSQREYMSHSGYLFLILGAKNSYLENARNPFRFPRSLSFESRDRQVTRFSESVSQMKEMLEKNGFIRLVEMTEVEIQRYERIYFSAFYRDFTIDLEMQKSHIEAGERKIGIAALTNEMNFPQSVSSSKEDSAFSSAADNFVFYQGMMDDMGITLDVSHIYNQIVIIDDSKHHVRKLEENHRNLQGARRFSLENQRGMELMQEYMDDISRSQNSRLVRGHSNIIYWSDKQSDFERASRVIQAGLRSLDFVPHVGKGASLRSLFLNSYPLNVTCMEESLLYLVDLGVSTALFVNNTGYKDSSQGVILNDRLFNKPVKFDFWDSDRKMVTSRNFCIVASTGKGKSFTANHIFRQLIEQGIILVIIDLGDSYLKLSKLFDKEDVMLFKYKSGEPLGLNPFLRDEKELSALKIEEICEFVWTLIKRDKEPSDVERTSLRKIVSHYYEVMDENHCWNSFYNFIRINSEKLYNILDIEDRSYFDLNEFLHVGSDFIGEGLYSNLFRDSDDRSSSFIGKKLIIFELDEIRENRLLLSIMLQVISEAVQKTIWSERKNRGIVFFDEFAKQLEFPEVTRRVKYYSQAIRKQNGGVGIVLQTLNQLPDTPQGRSILDNTETFIFLESNNHTDSISRLSLNEHDKSQLNSLRKKFDGERRYSEIYIKRGSYGNVFRIETAPELFLAYQTEGEIHTAIMELYEQTGSMEKAIEIYKNRI